MTGPVWNPMAQQYEPKEAPMSTQTMTLADFLLERIAEDETQAIVSCGDVHPTVDMYHPDGHLDQRRMAECEAKRKIVDLHQDGNAGHRWEGDPDSLPGYCTLCHNYDAHQPEDWPCTTLRLLALPFGSHPDYDEAWKP